MLFERTNTMKQTRPSFLVITTLLMLSGQVLMGCASLSPQATGEEQFGHRVEGNSSDGRATIAVTPPEEGTDYRYFAATYDTIVTRSETVSLSNVAAGVPVEVLIKGSFPDSCSQLHDVVQQKAGNLILVTLTMRRPQGAICASVLRPYRFYLTLDGLYSPGPYSLKLNDVSHPFVIRNPTGG